MSTCRRVVRFLASTLLCQCGRTSSVPRQTLRPSIQPLPPPVMPGEPIKTFPPLPLRYPINTDSQRRAFAGEEDPIIRASTAKNFDIIYRACRDSNKHSFVVQDPCGYEYVIDRSLQKSQGNIGSIWQHHSKLGHAIRITDIISISRVKTSGSEQEERTIVLTTGLGEVTWIPEVYLQILPTERFKQLRTALGRMPQQNNGSRIVTEFIIHRFPLLTMGDAIAMKTNKRIVTIHIRVERTRIGSKRVCGFAFIVNEQGLIQHPFALVTWIDTKVHQANWRLEVVITLRTGKLSRTICLNPRSILGIYDNVELL